MNCDEIRNLLSSYIDNETDEDETLLIEEHINNCDDCKKELEDYKKIIKALNDLPDEEPPAGYCKRLHEKLLNSKVTVFKDESVMKTETHRNKRSKYSWVKYGGMAAALVLVFTIASINNPKLGNFGMKSTENNSSYDMAGYPQVAPAPAPAMPESPAEMAIDGGRETEDYYIAADENMKAEESGYGNVQGRIATMSLENREMKIIKSGSIYTQTEDYDKFLMDLNSKIDSIGGFIENNNTEVYQVYDNNKLMYGNLKLRVPQDSFYDLIDYLENSTEVKRKNVNEKDVTKEYYEKDNKVKNLEIQEQHLRELFEKAQTVEEMLKIENELRRIRTEIDALNISLADIDDRATMSTINLEVEEVRAINFNIKSDKSIWERAKEGFISTINSIVRGLGNFLVSIVSALPIIVPAAIVFVVLLVKIKKYWKKKI